MSSLKFLTRGSGLKSLAPEVSPTNLHNQKSGDSDGHNQPLPLGKKRKRTEDGENNGLQFRKLSQEEIRQIQKSHKIKITDLKSLTSTDEDTSRKAQKEAARLYPQPLQAFAGLKQYEANHALLSNISEQGYSEPTEVQLATIPMLMSADAPEPNLLTVAPTGSGKTLAFLIPTIDKISKLHHSDKADDTMQHINSIILAPTKELVTQIVNEGRKLASRTGVRITAFKKGMKIHDDIDAHIEDESSGSEVDETVNHTVVKADIVVSTPLSLLHAITPTGQDTPLPLPNIRNLILDEADVLLDPLFREQTLAIWSACANKNLRASLWSATIGSNIEELTVSQITNQYKHLGLKSKHQPPLLRCIIGLKDTSLPNISHRLIYASTESGKLTGLRNLIRPPPSSTPSSKPTPNLHPPYLIFTQTISRAEALHSELQYDIPTPTTSTIPRIALLHSSLSDTARSTIMQNFRLGKIWILITTDLLSRGIDFRGVNAVINYDIPTTSASYVHRAGRTGRAGRQGGACITLYTREDVQYLRPIANLIQRARKAGGNEGEDEVPKWLMDALPALSKDAKRELKKRGVDVRRGVKESDDKKERRRKGRNVIETKSGYEKKLEDRRRGMVEGSKRRKEREIKGEDGDGFGGFD